ncbi:MAG: thiamine phosphate synthase, partial [Chloroflexota bacterium]
VLGADALIGWSVKGSADLARQAALRGVDYVAAGSIFPTTTKAGATVVGLEALREIRQAFSGPVAAIGGISLDTAAAVAEAGADLVCVVSAVVGAADVEGAARSLSDQIREGFSRRG